MLEHLVDRTGNLEFESEQGEKSKGKWLSKAEGEAELAPHQNSVGGVVKDWKKGIFSSWPRRRTEGSWS